MKPETVSSRAPTDAISRSCCFSGILSVRCEAIVSASLLKSSIWLIETSTSGGIFLFSLIYCSNCEMAARPRASSSWLSPATSSSSSAKAWKKASFRSEEHTSELQSLLRISYAVFCLKKKKQQQTKHTHTHPTLQ